MSNIVTTRIFLDGLREREAVAGAIAGSLRDLEASAERNGERVIWQSISLETETDLIDDRSLVHTGSFQHKSRTLTVSARTIDPAEVSA